MTVSLLLRSRLYGIRCLKPLLWQVLKKDVIAARLFCNTVNSDWDVTPVSCASLIWQGNHLFMLLERVDLVL